MAKISDFIIGIAVIGFMVTFFALFISGMSTNYNIEGAAVINLSKYNELNKMSNLTEETKLSVLNNQTSSNVVDLLGDFFKAGYQSIKVTLESITSFQSMTNNAIEDSNVGYMAAPLRTLIMTCIITIIIIGIVISALVKREM